MFGSISTSSTKLSGGASYSIGTGSSNTFNTMTTNLPEIDYNVDFVEAVATNVDNFSFGDTQNKDVGSGAVASNNAVSAINENDSKADVKPSESKSASDDKNWFERQAEDHWWFSSAVFYGGTGLTTIVTTIIDVKIDNMADEVAKKGAQKVFSWVKGVVDVGAATLFKSGSGSSHGWAKGLFKKSLTNTNKIGGDAAGNLITKFTNKYAVKLLGKNGVDIDIKELKTLAEKAGKNFDEYLGKELSSKMDDWMTNYKPKGFFKKLGKIDKIIKSGQVTSARLPKWKGVNIGGMTSAFGVDIGAGFVVDLIVDQIWSDKSLKESFTDSYGTIMLQSAWKTSLSKGFEFIGTAIGGKVGGKVGAMIGNFVGYEIGTFLSETVFYDEDPAKQQMWCAAAGTATAIGATAGGVIATACVIGGCCASVPVAGWVVGGAIIVGAVVGTAVVAGVKALGDWLGWW